MKKVEYLGGIHMHYPKKFVDKTDLSRSKCFQFPNFWDKKTNDNWHKSVSMLFTN